MAGHSVRSKEKQKGQSKFTRTIWKRVEKWTDEKNKERGEKIRQSERERESERERGRDSPRSCFSRKFCRRNSSSSCLSLFTVL